jgi:hypothetical protein
MSFFYRRAFLAPCIFRGAFFLSKFFSPLRFMGASFFIGGLLVAYALIYMRFELMSEGIVCLHSWLHFLAEQLLLNMEIALLAILTLHTHLFWEIEVYIDASGYKGLVSLKAHTLTCFLCDKKSTSLKN